MTVIILNIRNHLKTILNITNSNFFIIVEFNSNITKLVFKLVLDIHFILEIYFQH